MNKLTTGVTAGVLALSVLGTTLPTHTAFAQTQTDLQAQITALLAQIQQLQAQMVTPTSGVPRITLSRNLTIGMTGSDVKELQQFLNSDPATVVAVVGAGSKGNETMYFGPATQAAVVKFQNKYRTEVLTPVGLVSGTGYVGASTRAQINKLASVVVSGGNSNAGNTPVVTTPTPTTPTTQAPVGSILHGEGQLHSFTLDEADDTDIHEAASDALIATVTFKATDGDIEINRLDLALVADGSNLERDPWDTFETISLWVDDEKVAEKHIDNKSKYLNRSAGTLQFANLDIIAEEDEEVEVEVRVSVQNNVRGAGSAADWSVRTDRIRYFDADRVASDDSTTGDLGDSVDFSIVERGFGEELKFSLGANSPEEGTIVVDVTKRTANKTILEYTIEAIDADIDLDTLYVNIETGTANFNDVVSDLKIDIDGKIFKRDALTMTGSYSATNVLASFDVDGDITIDQDEKVLVKVIVELKPQKAYVNGETIIARITSAERDVTKAEGKDDIETFKGTVIGKEQVLVSNGTVSTPSKVRFSQQTQGSNDTIGVFTIEFDLTAVEGDFTIAEYASTSASVSTGGLQFMVDTTTGTPTTINATLSSTGKENVSGVFTVREGTTETFTLTVVVDAAAAGSHRVALEKIYFSDQTDGVTGGVAYSFKPATTYRSPYLFINN